MELLSYINNITKPIPIDVSLSTDWTASSLTNVSYPEPIIALNDNYLTTPDTMDSITLASGTLIYGESLRMAPSVTEEFRNEILQSVSDAIRDACSQYIGRPNNQVTVSSIASEVARILRSEEVVTTASTDSTGRVILSTPMPDYMDGIELNISPDIYDEDSS